MSTIDWSETAAAVWRPRSSRLRAVRRLDPIKLEQLLGVERQKQALIENTRLFLNGFAANNALLWGSRGTGKSSLIKALLNAYRERGLRVVEIDKDDLVDLAEIVDDLRELPYKFIVFCDDLSFEEGESGYKHLKSVLEGSIELPPENVLVYATSNRRHLMPEKLSENEAVKLVDGELHYTDGIEEKLSLADRFGLWLSFYPATQDQYLTLVDALFTDVEDREALHLKARQFAQVRGSRSGRTARQFYLSMQSAQGDEGQGN